MAIMDDIRRMMAERAAQGIGTGGGLFGTTNTQGQPTGLLGGLQNIIPNRERWKGGERKGWIEAR